MVIEWLREAAMADRECKKFRIIKRKDASSDESGVKIPGGQAVRFFCIYANNGPKSALARDLGDCRDNKGKLAKRVFTCLRELVLPGYIFKRNFEFTIYIDYTN